MSMDRKQHIHAANSSADSQFMLEQLGLVRVKKLKVSTKTRDKKPKAGKQQLGLAAAAAITRRLLIGQGRL